MPQVEKLGNWEIVQSTVYWGERGGLNLTWHKEFAKSYMNQDVLREKKSESEERPWGHSVWNPLRGVENKLLLKLSQGKQMILLAEGPPSVLVLWINFSKLLLMEM